MRKIVKFSVIGGATILLAACVNAKHYATAVNTWHGAPERALINQWGEPTAVTHLKNGNRLDTYYIVKKSPYQKSYTANVGMTSRLSPQPYSPGMLGSPPIVRHRYAETGLWCETTFEVDPQGMIVSTRYTGDNCECTLQGAKRRAFAQKQ